MTQPTNKDKQKVAVTVQVQVGNVAHKRVHPSRQAEFCKDLQNRLRAALGMPVSVMFHGGATTNIYAVTDGKLEGSGITAHQRDLIHTVILDMLMS